MSMMQGELKICSLEIWLKMSSFQCGDFAIAIRHDENMEESIELSGNLWYDI